MNARRWDAAIILKPGLFSKEVDRYQRGMREIAEEIGDAYVDIDNSGYGGYHDLVQRTLQTGRKCVPLIVHSNGGYFACRVANLLEPHGVDVPICCFDRTLKVCPAVGSNVPELINIHAGLQTIKTKRNFKGLYNYVDFRRESHVGVIYNERAKAIAVDFGKRWKERQHGVDR